jgi:superfamily I DNA/RNA helicase
MTELLRDRPDILAQYHRMFRYIMVDEYQDTNNRAVPLVAAARAVAQEHLLRRRR